MIEVEYVEEPPGVYLFIRETGKYLEASIFEWQQFKRRMKDGYWDKEAMMKRANHE